MAFPDLLPPLAAALDARGYSSLTPVQAAVTAPEADGRDLLVSARTGSGKTVAFGLALAGLVAERLEQGGGQGLPAMLVIAPTRELALQVGRELSWLYQGLGASIATCVGGMSASMERRRLSRGVDVVVGTPGRLRDHLESGALDLSRLSAAVLDEADEMLDMGFREDLEAILDGAPAERRTLLFSATLPPQAAALARRYQRDAFRIQAGGPERAHADIAYQAVAVAPHDLERATVNLLRQHEAETAILFCATRDNVRHLHASLVERGFAAVALSGEHSQSERNAALQALRDRRARVCVATDVAARGIDLPGVELVVHVELPRDPEVLQHRSGRTGRAGRKGTAVLLVPYPARRRAESLLRAARVTAEWSDPPSAEAIRAADRERLLERLSTPVEPGEEDQAVAAELVERLSPEQLAAALVSAHRGSLPEPEELSAPVARGAARDGQPPMREGFEDAAWFRLAIGRSEGADPRWVLPLVCRRGHVSRQEIGAIRVGPRETRFQVARGSAARFVAALQREPAGNDEARIEPAEDGGPPPRGGARGPASQEGGPQDRGPQGRGRQPGGYAHRPAGRPQHRARRPGPR